MITFTKQADGTWLQQGEFAAAPAEVQIKIDDGKPMATKYTLTNALELVKTAIAKGQVKGSVYTVLGVPEKEVVTKPAKAPKIVLTPEQKEAAKAAKTAAKAAAKAEKAASKPAAAPKPPRKERKYSDEKFVEIYKASNNSLDEVVKQTGASRVWAQRVLVRQGVWIAAPKKEKVVKPVVQLSPEEETRLVDIAAGFNETLDESKETADAFTARQRKAAIKQLRKEQKAANKPISTPKATKYVKADFISVYQSNGNSLDAVVKATGASKVWAQRVLVAAGVWVKAEKPAKTQAAATEPAAS